MKHALDEIAAILADEIFKWIFNENYGIPIKISLELVPMRTIDNKPALVHVMVCWRTDKWLPETMMPQFTDAYMRH